MLDNRRMWILAQIQLLDMIKHNLKQSQVRPQDKQLNRKPVKPELTNG